MNLWRFSVSGLLLGALVFGGAGCVSQPVKVRMPVSQLKKVVSLPPVVVSPVAKVDAAPAVVETSAPEPVAPRDENGEGFGIDRVARRLAVYEGRLYRWRAVTDQLMAEDVSGAKPLPDGWYDCLQQLEATYGDYNQLRRQIVVGGKGVEAITTWEVIDEDFAYQESGCLAIFRKQTAGSPVVEPDPVIDSESLADKVCEAVRKGKYHDALDLYGQIAQGLSGDQDVGVAVHQAYVVALLRTNKIDAALTELVTLLNKSGGFDSWAAQRQVADLLLATGKSVEAVKKYEELLAAFEGFEREKDWVREQLVILASGDEHAEELSVYQQALRSYLTFDGKRVPGELKMWVAQLEYKYPSTDIAVKARLLLNKVESESRTWISDKLLAVDALVDAREYKDALEMLEDLSGQELPKEMVGVVQKTMDEVVIVAAREQEELRLRTAQMLEERWGEADHLFDSEQFDQAIAVYTSLFGTTYDVKARVKIGDAAALAAAKLRREGAALFFKAGRTVDVAQKKDLLLQSRQLLQTILIKYPYVELVGKVSRNLQSLDEQLRVIESSSVDGVQGEGEADLPDGKRGIDGDNGAIPW